ncbi:MAG: hypothetical protein QOD83_2103 [Solirubrobacteraceae bacterium]|nr:hypothetical protein [Solirubrobacteraceae bacterium]
MRLSPSIAILRTQSDERLVEFARAGSEPAFAAIVERYRRQILRATRRVLPEARAEDAAQQAFMSAWLALGRGDDVLNLRSWLLMIARNTALNALRVPGYDYAELRESLRANEAPQDELERRDVMRQTLTGLAALPDRQREALLRSAVEGSSHADIAREMGLTEGATRQLVLRARMTLRSAATALTPWPLVSWLASRGGGDGETVRRLVEAAVVGGGAGTAAVLAKTGVVAVVAGGAIAAPGVMVQRSGDAATAAKAATPHHKAKSSRSAAVRPAVVRPAVVAAPVALKISDANGSQERDEPPAKTQRESGEHSRGHGRQVGSEGDDGHRSRQTGGHSESASDHGDDESARDSSHHDRSSANTSQDSGHGGSDREGGSRSADEHADDSEGPGPTSAGGPAPAPKSDELPDSPDRESSSRHGSVADAAASDDASND